MKFSLITLFVIFCSWHCQVFGAEVPVVGGPTMTVTMGGKENVLTVADITISADNGVFKIDGEYYGLNPTWAIFALKDGVEYKKREWTLTGRCGCRNQVCGTDCGMNSTHPCASNTIKEPWMCGLWPKEDAFCWNRALLKESQNFTVYNLSHIGTIALTNYSGPKGKFMEPGFTIKHQDPERTYSLVAMITGFTTRKLAKLSNFRYAESEGRIIALEEFKQLTSTPEIADFIVNTTNSTCKKNNEAEFSFHQVVPTLDAADKVGFRSYAVLRKANLSLSDLTDRHILSLNGISEWNEQKSFDVLDPCNQRFLTLKKDSAGNYFAELPSIQGTLVGGNIICIAINDVHSNVYDLVLYEMLNGDSVWRPSERFRGFLSSNYMESLELKITTDATLLIADTLPKTTVTIDINTDADIPILKVTTTPLPLTCQITLSERCVFKLSTTKEKLFAQKPIDDCGYWNEIGSYMCEGIEGTFHTPSKFVKAPISGFNENTTAVAATTVQTIPALHIPLDLGLFGNYWRDNSTFAKLMSSVMLIALILIIVYIVKTSREAKEAEEKQKIEKKSHNKPDKL